MLVFCEPWAPEEKATAPAEVLAELSLAHRGVMAIPELITEAVGCWAVISGPESGAHLGSLRSEFRDEAEMEALVCSGRLMPGSPSSLILTPPAVVRTTLMLTWLLPCYDPRSPAPQAGHASQALDHSQLQSLWELENGTPPFSLPTLHRAWLPSLANSVFSNEKC